MTIICSIGPGRRNHPPSRQAKVSFDKGLQVVSEIIEWNWFALKLKVQSPKTQFHLISTFWITHLRRSIVGWANYQTCHDKGWLGERAEHHLPWSLESWHGRCRMTRILIKKINNSTFFRESHLWLSSPGFYNWNRYKSFHPEDFRQKSPPKGRLRKNMPKMTYQQANSEYRKWDLLKCTLLGISTEICNNLKNFIQT